MTVDIHIRSEQLQCDINRKSAKTSSLLQGKVGKI